MFYAKVHGMFISINVARCAKLAKLDLKKKICSSKSPMTKKNHKHSPVKSFFLYIAKNSSIQCFLRHVSQPKSSTDYNNSWILSFHSINHADATRVATLAQLKNSPLAPRISDAASLAWTCPQHVLLYVTLFSLAAASNTDPGGEP